jgi:RHS repeat-associated protein
MAVTRQTVSGTTTTTYYGTDHLGTVRATVTVDAAGTEQYRTFHDYEPFGLELPVRDTVSPNTHRFTGHERDTETGYDYMHFRYYGSIMGRFMKPDNIMGNLANPQSWNLYSYVHGNPVNFNDPTGHMVGVAWRNYTWAGGDIAGSMGIHQEANAWGGGLGLDEHPLDANPIGIIDWAIIDNILHAHTDWAGIYAAWRGGANSGTTPLGTPYSVNAFYSKLAGDSNGTSGAYNLGILTASNNNNEKRIAAGEELAEILRFVHLNISRYHWTNYVFRRQSCYDYAYRLAADIKMINPIYWVPQIWQRYVPPHYSVVLQPTIHGVPAVWIDAYTSFEFHVFEPTWNYALDDPNP